MNPITRRPFLVLVIALSLGGCAPSTDPQGPDTYQLYAIGVREPATLSAAAIELLDDELVIGVSVGYRHRAYLVAAFKPPPGFLTIYGDSKESQKALGRHVVNDLIEGVPVSVSYCDLNSCVRVFTGRGRTSLDLAINGRRDGEMELSLYRTRFLQTAADVPLEDFPFAQVTWKQWKRAHPDTDLYVGSVPITQKTLGDRDGLHEFVERLK